MNRAFAEKYEFSFSLLSDADHSVAVAYGAAKDLKQQAAGRTGVVIDAEGKILCYKRKVDALWFPVEALELLQQHRS